MSPNEPTPNPSDAAMHRRKFVQRTAVAASTGFAASRLVGAAEPVASVHSHCSFPAQDSLVHPPEWESLNPGYWKIEGGRLRRRLTNVGDRARRTGFPFHYESKGTVMETDYDPSLPSGILYRRDQYLTGRYCVEVAFVYHADAPEPSDGDDVGWKMFQPGNGMMGIAIGAKSLMESFHSITNATQIALADDGTLVFLGRSRWKKGVGRQHPRSSHPALVLSPGDELVLRVEVVPDGRRAAVTVTLTRGEQTVAWGQTMTASDTEGYVGVVGRGQVDFSVKSFAIESVQDRSLKIQASPCLACYALGDTLSQNEEGHWTVRFIGLFDRDGQNAEVRVSDIEDADWASVMPAGRGAIVSNDFRRNTAVIDVVLPHDPGDKTMYYTVWKDGVNVTPDLRIGTAAVGPGTGFVGDVPASGSYVGRLPKLAAPYRLCGLSCHAITSGLQQRSEDGYKIRGGNDVWQVRDQPTVGAYAHLEAYDFQVMVWEDDVWYMELVLYPPSTDDAYKIITQSICGPTSRWQLMRHWNVINPGDHDYGMDDVKGPEQIIIRRQDGLGQDASYMRRNFQIVHHLITGAEEVDPLANPKKWRSWKMPHRDFTFVILDSRLWRSSQNVDIWGEHGWNAFKGIYDRTDPTRSLLGEEQFGWLQELLATDSSRLICLTGINGLHTIWTGGKGDFESGKHPMNFSQRDRVTADYAGWVKAGADRVLELLGGRDGVVTVYGDVHNGSILTNDEQRVIECSFGPIGRSGGRGVIPGFGPHMKDVDGRDVTVHSLYHKDFADPMLSPHDDSDPFYWNFLEMEFDPRPVDPQIELRIRNLVDAPMTPARGGGERIVASSQTGRIPTSQLPDVRTLSDAEIQILEIDGRPIRGTRSLRDGTISLAGLVDVPVGEEVLIVAHRNDQTEAIKVRTVALKG